MKIKQKKFNSVMAGKQFQQERCDFNKYALFTIIKQMNTYQPKDFWILKLDSLYQESFQSGTQQITKTTTTAKDF